MHGQMHGLSSVMVCMCVWLLSVLQSWTGWDYKPYYGITVRAIFTYTHNVHTHTRAHTRARTHTHTHRHMTVLPHTVHTYGLGVIQKAACCCDEVVIGMQKWATCTVQCWLCELILQCVMCTNYIHEHYFSISYCRVMVAAFGLTMGL